MKNKNLKKAVFLILIVWILTVIYIGINKKQLEYVSDFNYMYNYLKSSYPNFYRNGTKDWLKHREEFLKLIESSKNDEEFLNNMNNVLYALNDMHVFVYNKELLLTLFNLSKEVNNQEQSEKSDIGTKTLKRYGISEEEINKQNEKKVKIGHSLIKNNKENLSVGSVVPGKVGYIRLREMLMYKITTVENHKIKYKKNKLVRRDEKVLVDFLKEIQNYDSLIIDLRDNPGGNYFYVSHFFLPTIIGNSKCEEVVYKFAKDKEEIEELKESSIKFKEYYDTDEIESVTNKNLKKIKKEVPALEDENLFKDIEDNFKNYVKITYKTGESLDNSLAFKGKIYFLINKNSGSCADKFPRIVKINNIGTLVGERTAGDGEVTTTYKVLPKTKFVMGSIATLDLVKGLNSEDSKTVGPDIYVPDSTYRIKETENGLDFSKDRVIKKVLDLEGYN